ncbi:hypothetical protein [Variovorax rhizosphaerae]|uniref:DUF4352 domain-containing protein n=1 Tax=Variovorax rhizosphaerae TaxID=1836200 RepID=A0ABU8WL36_9BURK
MKKFVIALAVLASAAALAEEPAQEESSVKKAVKSATSGAISLGKSMMSGVSDGVTDGRKTGEAADGAVLVSNLAEFEAKVDARLLTIAAASDDRVDAEFALRNHGKKPVRMINLQKRGTVLILDKDAFAHELSSDTTNPLDVTIPENAGIKVKFTFNGTAKDMVAVRVWGKEFKK